MAKWREQWPPRQGHRRLEVMTRARWRRLRRFVGAWLAEFGREPVTARGLVPLAVELGVVDREGRPSSWRRAVNRALWPLQRKVIEGQRVVHSSRYDVEGSSYRLEPYRRSR